jgi:hypothetical protein
MNSAAFPIAAEPKFRCWCQFKLTNAGVAKLQLAFLRREQLRLYVTMSIRLRLVILAGCFLGGGCTKEQGNRILIAGKSGEDPCQEVVIPACLEPFAAEAAF